MCHWRQIFNKQLTRKSSHFCHMAFDFTCVAWFPNCSTGDKRHASLWPPSAGRMTCSFISVLFGYKRNMSKTITEMQAITTTFPHMHITIIFLSIVSNHSDIP